MKRPVCGELGGFRNQTKHNEHQVPPEALLESGWLDEAHEQIKKERRDAKEREAQRPNPGRAAAAADIEAFAEQCLARAVEVAPQMTGCANRHNLTIVEAFHQAASIARAGNVKNENCSNCGNTRGGPMGHTTEECTWLPPEGIFDERDACLGDEISVAQEFLLGAAEALLSLKDGPRDEAYERAKEPAWDYLRRAVASFKEERRYGSSASV